MSDPLPEPAGVPATVPDAAQCAHLARAIVSALTPDGLRLTPLHDTLPTAIFPAMIGFDADLADIAPQFRARLVQPMVITELVVGPVPLRVPGTPGSSPQPWKTSWSPSASRSSPTPHRHASPARRDRLAPRIRLRPARLQPLPNPRAPPARANAPGLRPKPLHTGAAHANELTTYHREAAGVQTTAPSRRRPTSREQEYLR